MRERIIELLREHDLKFNKVYSDPDKAEKFNKELITGMKTLRQINPTLFDTVAMFAMWFVPYFGPWMAATYGSVVGYKKLKKGVETNNKSLQVEGIIDLLTGPIALGRTVRILKFLGHNGNKVQMLNKIHKSGIAVLVAQGWNSFLNWGVKNFGDEFLYFTKLLEDKKLIQQALGK